MSAGIRMSGEMVFGGEMEVILEAGPRVDCITDTHAIEMDFAKKWPEAIGQSLHYAHLTGLEAGIVIILRSHNDTPTCAWPAQ